MDPAEILKVRFHFGGEFVHIGNDLDYVGGDEAVSEIERDKLSLQEVLGFLKDHMEVKSSVKLYFLLPGRELVSGLQFLYDDAGCLKMSEHTTDGGVADIYVEYHVEEDVMVVSSGSDFEDEAILLADSDSSLFDVPEVLTTEDALVPGHTGVITQVTTSPEKNMRRDTGSFAHDYLRMGKESSSKGMAGSSQVINSDLQCQVENYVCEDIVMRDANNERTETMDDEYSDSSEDSDYVPHSDDSGEESEVVDLRKKAKQFKKKMRASQRWVDSENATGAVPIDLVANVEEVLEEMNRELVPVGIFSWQGYHVVMQLPPSTNVAKRLMNSLTNAIPLKHSIKYMSTALNLLKERRSGQYHQTQGHKHLDMSGCQAGLKRMIGEGKKVKHQKGRK